MRQNWVKISQRVGTWGKRGGPNSGFSFFERQKKVTKKINRKIIEQQKKLTRIFFPFIDQRIGISQNNGFFRRFLGLALWPELLKSIQNLRFFFNFRYSYNQYPKNCFEMIKSRTVKSRLHLNKFWGVITCL